MCAGFKHGERYFVADEFARIPCPALNNPITCAEIVFGSEYQRWCREYEAEDGDKGSDATEFLFEVAPFLAQKHLLYGHKWIDHFPHFEITTDLRSMKIPGYQSYEMFAADMKRSVEQVTPDVLPNTGRNFN